MTTLDIHHVWHDDNGFRKCTILNKAIQKSSTDYIIFSDGDCIPRKDFIETHIKYARQGHFLSGGAVRLPLDISQLINSDHIKENLNFKISWLKKNGMNTSGRAIKLGPIKFLAFILNRITPSKTTWNGGNSSGWKKDLLKINGFDERLTYGSEDCEMGERLVNSGIKGIKIRYSAITVHLEHGRAYVEEESRQNNRRIRKHVRENNISWTEYGIVKADK